MKTGNFLKRILVSIGVVLVVVAIVFFSAKSSFIRYTGETLLSNARVKQLEAEASLSGQLALVRQMIKSKAISRYMKNPTDTNAFNAAFDEFSGYKDSFLSKSIFWINDVDKQFWSDMEVAYTLDPEKPSEYWYKMTMYETEEYNFNINYNPQLQSVMLWVNAVVRDENNKSVGIAGTGIPLTDFVKSMYNGIADDITMYLYTDAGKIVGAKDLSLLEKELNIKEYFAPAKEINDIIPTEPQLKDVGFWEIALQPITLLGLHIIIARQLNFSTLINYIPTPLSICLVVLLVAGFVFVFIKLVSFINELFNATELLSSGNADLTARVSLSTSNSFKMFTNLTESLNKFIEKLQGIVKEIKDTKASLSGDGGKLDELMQSNTKLVNGMASGIKNVEGQLDVQSEKVENVVGAVGKISTSVEALDELLTTQEQGVQTASSAVTEMIGNIESVSHSVENMADKFDGLKKDVASGIEKELEVSKQIQKIEEQSKMLNEANAVISAIADQTNLLAMNAAIEAAHAGDAGKGFAVVADEIRKLSENSATQSKGISHQLSDILDSISNVVESSTQSDEIFTNVSRKITDTGNLVQEIKQAMSEQAEGSKQIVDALGNMNDTTSKVRGASENVDSSRKEITDDVENMKQASLSVQDSLEEIKTDVRLIEDGDNSLSNISKELTNSIDRIGTQIDQFKV